jgi:hypothetical protein
VYGDPVRWTTQKSAAFTVLSFLNTNKYPPSLLFLLMTLRPAMLFLWAVDARTPQWLRPALVFGKVPMFYYLLHIPLIHLLAVIVCYARYGQVHWMFESLTVGQFPITPPPAWGFDRVRDSPLKRVGADALVHPAARSAAALRRSVATLLSPRTTASGAA